MLLDSGSTPVTRKAAAEQIGEVQKLHPHELQNLLKKVTTLNPKMVLFSFFLFALAACEYGKVYSPASTDIDMFLVLEK